MEKKLPILIATFQPLRLDKSAQARNDEASVILADAQVSEVDILWIYREKTSLIEQTVYRNALCRETIPTWLTCTGEYWKTFEHARSRARRTSIWLCSPNARFASSCYIHLRNDGELVREYVLQLEFPRLVRLVFGHQYDLSEASSQELVENDTIAHCTDWYNILKV